MVGSVLFWCEHLSIEVDMFSPYGCASQIRPHAVPQCGSSASRGCHVLWWRYHDD